MLPVDRHAPTSRVCTVRLVRFGVAAALGEEGAEPADVDDGDDHGAEEVVGPDRKRHRAPPATPREAYLGRISVVVRLVH